MTTAGWLWAVPSPNTDSGHGLCWCLQRGPVAGGRVGRGALTWVRANPAQAWGRGCIAIPAAACREARDRTRKLPALRPGNGPSAKGSGPQQLRDSQVWTSGRTQGSPAPAASMRLPGHSLGSPGGICGPSPQGSEGRVSTQRRSLLPYLLGWPRSGQSAAQASHLTSCWPRAFRLTVLRSVSPERPVGNPEPVQQAAPQPRISAVCTGRPQALTVRLPRRNGPRKGG